MFISPNTFFANSTVDFVSPPSTAEIGIPLTLSVSVTLDSGSTVTNYRWECDFLGSPFDQSPYIPGWFDYQSSGYEYASSSTVSSVNVQFGSFFDATTKKIVEVFVTYTDKDGKSEVISKTAEIEVPRICPPNIGGDLDVASCCTEDRVYSIGDFCNGNTFQWTVSGATIVSGQGTATVVVSPPALGGYSISCIVGRSQANPLYTYSESRSIGRFASEISKVDVPPSLCQGDTSTFITPAICGYYNYVWSIGTGASIVGGQGTTQIQVTPLGIIANGSSIPVSLYATSGFGCITDTFNFSIKVYTAETPPTPTGSIYAALSSGADPCTGPYDLFFSNPYTNGTTTLRPSKILILPHHKNKPISVKVCYYNLCSELETCTFFTVDPPPPCEDPLPIVSKHDTLKEQIVLRDIKLSESLISPNPFQTELNIVFEKSFTGDISIINMQGGEIYHCQLKDVIEKKLNIGYQLSKGIYFLIQRGGNGTSIHKIIKI